MEETRLDRLKLVLQAYVELQRSVSPEILSACDKMNAVVSAINPSGVCKNNRIIEFKE